MRKPDPDKKGAAPFNRCGPSYGSVLGQCAHQKRKRTLDWMVRASVRTPSGSSAWLPW